MPNCDGCTLCCELFEVKDFNKPAYIMCGHCDGTGCLIHSTRPEVCRKFECVYTRMENSHIRTRPDKMGVVWEKPSDEIFHGTIRPGEELTTDAKIQIMDFNRQGFSVFIRDGWRYTLYASDKHDEKEMMHKMDEIAKERHGRT